MNAPEKFFLPDIQSVSDGRRIAINRVAYDNPKFVEDLVRDIALRLNRDERVRAYVLESENFESIHNHSAYALVERDKDREQEGTRSGAQALAAASSSLAPAT
jgi:hypothetical protein